MVILIQYLHCELWSWLNRTSGPVFILMEEEFVEEDLTDNCDNDSSVE